MQGNVSRFALLILSVAASFAVLLGGCSVSSVPPVPLEATPNASLAGTRNTAYSATLSANGGVPPYTWSVSSGNVPPGLVLSPTGILSGTPNSAGTYSFTAQVTDLAHPQEVANVSISVTIVEPVFIATASLPNTSPDVFYSATLSATDGAPPYRWKLTRGNLPTGMVLNATSGVISGTTTDVGPSNFSVQISDSQSPAATASMSLSISINPPPPRNSALYIAGGGALHVNSDGSLTPLPSVVAPLVPLAFSPKLPILFAIDQDQEYTIEQPSPDKPYVLSSMLVNPDYSLTPIASVTLPAKPNGGEFFYRSIVVDGSNLYVPGFIDDQGTLGIRIYAADGSLDLLSTIAVPNFRSLSSTPDGAWVFVADGPDYLNSRDARILVYSRSSSGTLTQAATYPLGLYTFSLYVSPDGNHLASVIYPPPHGLISYPVTGVGVGDITNGTITEQAEGFGVPLFTDPIWDESSSYLLVPIMKTPTQPDWPSRGAGVFSLSGNGLTVFADPTGVGATGLGQIQGVGSFFYISQSCTPPPSCVSCSKEPNACSNSSGTYGFTFANGQLEPLPSSQLGWSSRMVVY